jgi:uncharacterized BrkB/YihY/UPF0761 family membrane protein
MTAADLRDRSLELIRPWWVWRWVMRCLEVEFIDRSVALAAKAFVSLVPFVVVIGSLLPQSLRDEARAGTRERLGISGELALSVDQALPDANVTVGTVGVIGVLLLLFYATSFGTSLQRLYAKAWRRPPAQRSSRIDVLRWLTGFIAYAMMLSLLRGSVDGADGALLTLVSA